MLYIMISSAVVYQVRASVLNDAVTEHVTSNIYSMAVQAGLCQFIEDEILIT